MGGGGGGGGGGGERDSLMTPLMRDAIMSTSF